MPQYSFSDIPHVEAKVAIITGSNEGIGKITARELVRKGWHVIMACRNEKKAQDAIQEIRTQIGNNGNNNLKLDFIQLDLASYDSIHKFVDEFHQRHLSLHLLINNGGTYMPPFALTNNGQESHFGVNHLGHFLLTNLLLDDLKKSVPSRIVIVTSRSHMRCSNIEFDDATRNRPYPNTGLASYRARNAAYSQSKLANMMFCKELSERLGTHSKLFCNAVHPGIIRTNIFQYVNILKILLYPFMRTVENGSMTTLYVATHPDIETKNIHGAYFVPSKRIPPPYIRPAEVDPNPIVLNKTVRERLWELSKLLTGLTYTV
ncbi:unnamed protein product [Didymodactylos carnosus]|uniref:Uncharacterized protein n=1 Tax=Didymodactylos carnosus TaxID=1234261 RepID=A0A814P6U1_9BILA|nr:unnamed protein product [Didymodactylos carnosus]CAF1321914.1 unnamed protein product [Didymodactylos carnosus]CAF3868510.1 unnamed protein product [Didymodactylos carnosus]CAF4131993.1 unnamed protein product [Didymodactylos carnosus]